MSQYKTGSVTVENGSNIIIGSGTAWLANISVGDWFKIDDIATIYQVSEINTDTQLKLSVNYGGSDGNGLAYCIAKDFTPLFSIPQIYRGDIDWPDFYNRMTTIVETIIAAHHERHENGGADEISAIGLSGLLADDQHVLDDEVLAVAEDKAKKGVASGYCDLDASTLVPLTRIPTPLTGKDTDTLDGQHASALILPTGSIVAYGGTSAPSGYLMCDGSEVSETTYATLFAIIGHAFGDPGGGNFNLPDLRQRFPLGKAVSGTGSTLGGTGGAIDHTHTGPSHTHSLPTMAGYDGAIANYQLSGVATGVDGTGATGTNNPPFQVVNYIIKV